jgi:proline iminopeptidase
MLGAMEEPALRSASYPVSAPYAQGCLDVGDGHSIHWEICGNPDGKPAVVLHGGPGSGSNPSWTELFDPTVYRVVLVDQRGCGRSTPNAAQSVDALVANTTQHLVADLELLRVHLAIDRWLVMGASWGSVLGLAYAQAHLRSVSELVLFSVVGGSRREVVWATRGMGRFYPEEWRRFQSGVPASDRDGDLSAAYYRLLLDPDPVVHERAARDWCDWDDRQMRAPGERPSRRYGDPAFRLCSARLVTHYWSHGHFMPDGALAANAARRWHPGRPDTRCPRPRPPDRPLLATGARVARQRARADRRTGPPRRHRDGRRSGACDGHVPKAH